MGMAPYGNPLALGLPPLAVDRGMVFLPARWTALLADQSRFRFAANGTRNFQDIADLAAAGQRAFEDALLEVARWLHHETGAENLCFAGGIALNCSANDRLLRESRFRRLFIPPAPSDAGTALGCTLYGLLECLGQPSAYRWEHDFLGPGPDPADVEAAVCGAEDLIVERPENLWEGVVGLLVQNKVVGLYQGRSEFGPRALGHRSILADPRHPGMHDWINARVRPAPSGGPAVCQSAGRESSL
jgi:carbamoyltransferase